MPDMAESGRAEDQMFVGKSDDATVYGTRGEPKPLPNRADKIWSELIALRAEARRLGIPIDGTESLVQLRQYIADAQAAE